VPVNTARSVAGQILDDGTADHAFIGITGADAESGALVRDVTAGGPADLAGLQPGRDVIVAAGGEAVSGMEDLIAIVNTRQPGEEIELEVERDGERRSVTVELGARPTGGDPEVTQPG
jgi:S1-C subfamily serine protease